MQLNIQPDNLEKIHIVSPWVVIISILQFLMLFFFKYVSGMDNTNGYVVNYFSPAIYACSFVLVLTALNGIYRRSVGLLDLVLVALVLIISFSMIQ
jgi:hypothetical protein